MGRRSTEFPQGDRIFMRFPWNGKRIKQSLPDKVTSRNIERAGQLRREIVLRIRFGNFTQEDFYGHFPHRRPKTIINELRFFGQYAQTWLDSIEVSANIRNEYKKVLNRYWVPRYVARCISSISYSEHLRDNVVNGRRQFALRGQSIGPLANHDGNGVRKMD